MEDCSGLLGAGKGWWIGGEVTLSPPPSLPPLPLGLLLPLPLHFSLHAHTRPLQFCRYPVVREAMRWHSMSA